MASGRGAGTWVKCSTEVAERYILYNDLNQLLRVPKNAIQESHSGNPAERPNVAKQKQ